MLNTTKIRLYPNDKQASLLAQSFGCTRWFWNNSLAETQKRYHETGKGLSHFDMTARLPHLKQEFDWLTVPYSQSLQSVALNLSQAFISFFQKRTQFPRFKSKHDKQTLQFPQGVKVVEDRKLYCPKLGHIKAKIHRKIEGKIKTVTLSKDPSGRYFASILSETEHAVPAPNYEGKILGIDVGLTHLAITSDGVKFNNPKHIKRYERLLKRRQQSLSRKQKGSCNRNKARIAVAKVHESISNCRKDYLHKVSKKLVDENQVIAVEDLAVKNMMKNHKLAKAISDVGWNMLSGFLEYKARKQGKGFIKVDRYFSSSKACSGCGFIHKGMSLDIREWVCPQCNAKHDRDINASKNIALEAKRLISAGYVDTAYGGTVKRKVGKKTSCSSVSACEIGSPSL